MNRASTAAHATPARESAVVVVGEVRVLAEFLAATRDNGLADITFKRRRGFLGLAVSVLLAVLSAILPHDVKMVSEAGSGLLAVFMGSPLIVGVRPSLDRVRAYEALRSLLMTPGADASAVEQARTFLKKTLGGGA